MLCVFHVSSSMVYYSTRNVTLNSVSSGKAYFGFATNAVDFLGCTHYVMSVYDVQRDCFKIQPRNHLITFLLFLFFSLSGVFFFFIFGTVLCFICHSFVLACCHNACWIFLTFSRSLKLLNESRESLNLKSRLVVAHDGSQAFSWSFSAENADFWVIFSHEQVDFNRLCWNETTDRCSEDYVDLFTQSHV